MDQELHDLIISLKKQNANSVFELLKAQKRMSDLEKKSGGPRGCCQCLVSGQRGSNP